MFFPRRVGYWWSEKKSQKINDGELARLFNEKGYEFVKIDLDVDIEKQGPFDAIIHKLSDVLCKVDRDEAAVRQINSFETFAKQHPEVVIIDSLDNVRKVLDRYRQYKIIDDSELAKEDSVFIPPFVEMTSTDVEENIQKMKNGNVQFPFVCKSILAHGSKYAHKMSIIFNEGGLKSINPPCVAQTFINHNARLFKLFIIKDKYFVIERPSIKNFKSNLTYETVHFDSHDISKPYSSSVLNELDEEDAKTCNIIEPDKERFDRIVKVISKELGLYLLGIDVIIENDSGHYAIIDINAFPGYDGVDNFLELYRDIVINEVETVPKFVNGHNTNALYSKTERMCLSKQDSGEISCNESGGSISDQANNSDQSQSPTKHAQLPTNSNDFDSGIDTSDSCDERKNHKAAIPIKMYKKQHSNRLQQQQSHQQQQQQQQSQLQVLQSVTERIEKL